MIENFAKGTIITDFDFKDVNGSPLSEVSVGVRDASVTVTQTKVVSIWCGLRTKHISTINTVNFRLLPYAQGAINYCEPMGLNVISAYFSGCIMARYKRNGSWRVCHVSTGEANDCKNKWNEIKAESTVSEVTEFKPHNHVTGGNKILGLITSTGSCYAIGCKAIELNVKETRSAEQILLEEGAKFRIELTLKEKQDMAKAMALHVKKVQALEVMSFAKIE
jgi:hypothetical protein